MYIYIYIYIGEGADVAIRLLRGRASLTVCHLAAFALPLQRVCTHSRVHLLHSIQYTIRWNRMQHDHSETSDLHPARLPISRSSDRRDSRSAGCFHPEKREIDNKESMTTVIQQVLGRRVTLSRWIGLRGACATRGQVINSIISNCR